MGTPYLIQTAWAVVTQLVRDWQVNPSMFCTEHDVQAELYSRLKTTLLNLGEFYIEDKPSNNIIDQKSRHLWPRLNCEYSISYERDGEQSYMKPDIVLWNDLESIKKHNLEKKYSEIFNGLDNWPMLWVCEIKFDSDITVERTTLNEVKNWFRTGEKENDYNEDLKKMNTLISYGENEKPYLGTQYAGVLNLVRVVAPGDGLYWDPEFKGEKGKLWMLHAYLPEAEFKE